MRLLREEDMEDFQEEVGVVWDHSKCSSVFSVGFPTYGGVGENNVLSAGCCFLVWGSKKETDDN